MAKKDIINKIKDLLFSSVKEDYIDLKGKDGEIYRITNNMEDIQKGNQIRIINEEGHLVTPSDSEVVLNDSSLVTFEDGVIVSVSDYVVEKDDLIENEGIMEETSGKTEDVIIEEVVAEEVVSGTTEEVIVELDEIIEEDVVEAVSKEDFDKLAAKVDELLMSFSKSIDEKEKLTTELKTLNEKFSEFKTEPIKKTPEVVVGNDIKSRLTRLRNL